ncbi:hypothetical protein, partial [Bradyrhizobium sp. ARR65]|uniref:hypothetical protein n=1 Tax=Bradyrhizobium sp. ARR65 TaxID=1040989 RepID=UPI001AECD868
MAVYPSRLVEPVIGPGFARTRWLAPPATNGEAVCAGMTDQSMIRKSVKRFSEKIMLKQESKARWRFDLIPSRFR